MRVWVSLEALIHRANRHAQTQMCSSFPEEQLFSDETAFHKFSSASVAALSRGRQTQSFLHLHAEIQHCPMTSEQYALMQIHSSYSNISDMHASSFRSFNSYEIFCNRSVEKVKYVNWLSCLNGI